MIGIQDIVVGMIVAMAAVYLLRAMRRAFAQRGCSGCPASGGHSQQIVPLQINGIASTHRA